ncbi:hypothetical protein [Nonomuraea lactucae]|uniref:hypothetical protein n=1 Tax=Nonomuraea lactucae TaxID=2249762 RepID=UPI000DE4A14D|nr:hypothetical protein [Nonomuraea lactucae]
MTSTTPNLPAIATWPVPDRVRYSEELAKAGLLPDAYRRQPSNVLYAIEWGIALNIEPMVAIVEVHVIKGKPTASAGLMSALVRRAGHKLRTWVDHDEQGNPVKAVTTIIRADDSDFEFRSEWTMQRAARAGLVKQNENYGKYTEQMLKARSVGECARDACKEALLGFTYVPEELGAQMNEDGSYVVTGATVQAGASVREAAAAAQEAAGVVMANSKKLKDLADLMDAKGVKDKLGYIREMFPDHEFNSAHDLTAAQADQVINALNRGVNLPAQQDAPDEAQNNSAPASEPAAPAPAGEQSAAVDKEDPVEADIVEDEPADPKDLRDLGILMMELGITPHTGRGSTKLNDEARFAWLSKFLGVKVEGSTKNLTRDQAQRALAELKRLQVERAKRRSGLYKLINESFNRLGITNAEDRFRDISDLLGRTVMKADDLAFDEVETVSDLLEQALDTETPRPTWDTMIDAAKKANQAQTKGQADQAGQVEQQSGGF